MKKLRHTFKTTITTAQSMKFLASKKDPKRSFPDPYLYLVAVRDACGGAESLVLENVVHNASSELRTVIMAKDDRTRSDQLCQAQVVTTRAFASVAHVRRLIVINYKNTRTRRVKTNYH